MFKCRVPLYQSRWLKLPILDISIPPRRIKKSGLNNRIIITIGIEHLRKEEDFIDLWNKLEQYSNFNKKIYPSITNKSKFKIMDLMDDFATIM